MIHRAIFGSLERFMGILIENFAGAVSYKLAASFAAQGVNACYAMPAVEALKFCCRHT